MSKKGPPPMAAAGGAIFAPVFALLNNPWALLWAIIWDMLRDAELSATDFVDILLSAIEAETNISVVTTLGGQLQSAIEVYASPKNRDSLRVKAAAKIYDVLKNSKAGGDFQLQFTRVFASLAAKEDAPKLQSILNGDTTGRINPCRSKLEGNSYSTIPFSHQPKYKYDL